MQICLRILAHGKSLVLAPRVGKLCREATSRLLNCDLVVMVMRHLQIYIESDLLGLLLLWVHLEVNRVPIQ